jgi:hypothetical protein
MPGSVLLGRMVEIVKGAVIIGGPVCTGLNCTYQAGQTTTCAPGLVPLGNTVEIAIGPVMKEFPV